MLVWDATRKRKEHEACGGRHRQIARDLEAAKREEQYKGDETMADLLMVKRLHQDNCERAKGTKIVYKKYTENIIYNTYRFAQAGQGQDSQGHDIIGRRRQHRRRRRQDRHRRVGLSESDRREHRHAGGGTDAGV